MQPDDTYQDALPRIARDAITARLTGRSYAPPTLPEGLDRPAGVFVTLWKAGDLRGCIGHIAPVHRRLVDEVADCARLAALRDPRFGPVLAGELPDITLEVSVLGPTEPVGDLSTLDPHRYGVVVSCGARRGVLLPNVHGVETVEDQLSIAMRKAGIRADEEWTVERFEVLKFEETLPDTNEEG